ncbi:sugar kinase [Sodalis sp. RH21]|uniref:sugar kinase n=1 Tax=unclassified Sodalis (in: enterobacteria) TaxID=2636512 RepID=UPI0039B52D9A
MRTICTIGEILVEFLAKEINQDLTLPGEFTGPFPSGAPAIYADQVAMLGFPSMLFSCVGADTFGTLCMNRLRRDGVNIANVAVIPAAVTGTAFVSYQNQTQRNFIFNMTQSANGYLSAEYIDEHQLSNCRHLHIMGSSLFSFRIIDAICKAIHQIKNNHGTISFDPNIRKEMLNIPEMSQAFDFIMEYTDIFLPSESELDYFAESEDKDEEHVVAKLLADGIGHVVIKRGAKGASYYAIDGRGKRIEHHIPGFSVDTVDPTGAGDCFGATFVCLLLEGYPVKKALRFAAASGALAISRQGPMEGTSTLPELELFVAAGGQH